MVALEKYNSETRRRLNGRDKFAMKRRRGFRCQVTGEIVDSKELDVHHAIPFSTGGSNEWWNSFVIKRDIHRKLHKIEKLLINRHWRRYEGANRDEKRKNARVQICKQLTQDVVELNNLSEIADKGYDPRYVYSDEYRYDFQTRARIIGLLEG